MHLVGFTIFFSKYLLTLLFLKNQTRILMVIIPFKLQIDFFINFLALICTFHLGYCTKIIDICNSAKKSFFLTVDSGGIISTWDLIKVGMHLIDEILIFFPT